jgi:lysophospholipase L1-like esterase
MNAETKPASRGTRIIKAMLLALGAGLVAYALSDQPFYGGPPGIGTLQKLIAGAGAIIALGALLPRRFGEKLLLLTISGLLMLMLAEIAGNVILGPVFRPIYREDPNLIFAFIPGRKSTNTLPPINGGATITHRINDDGFRGGPLLERVPGRKRVVVYGDSFIHAYYAADADTFPVRLEGALKARTGADVEVVNAGVSSYGPDQISVKIQQELPKLKPDLLVVSIFAGNDYGDLMRNKMFRLAADGTLVVNPWRLDPAVSEAFSLSQRESILVRALRATAAARSAPVGPACNASSPDRNFLLAEARREYESLLSGNPLVTNTHVDYYSADVSLQPDSESARYKVAMMDQVLERIRKISAAANVPLVFLFIPHPADLTEKYDWGAVDLARYPGYKGRNQVAPLERFAAATSSNAVSLFDAFQANDPNRLYMHGGDDHWSPAGQALAADMMAGYIVSHGLLAAH